ncbi:Flagellar hook-associated protein 2 [Posidoniimonas polymericola]|uniref:Filament cap protein n=1 Tax=Posidoniimonas polymericola TaxID=2528002 RepID=A0A5C5YG93_9BACT|nr:flagellar filament capping protein FliD [Posidoniimonas polymericola]TWT73541.1 Flagellar hook-associated protein 2 [Posidoniimonas polymericola]
MSAIQTSVGLISGIPIEDTVNQLISVARQPLSRLNSRTEGLLAERTAVDTLATLVLGLQSSINSFKSASTFTKKAASSSDATLVSAKITSGKSPKAGSYKFTPIQSASAHRLLSGGFSDLENGLGDGTLSFRFGGHVNKGVSLSEINAGAGFKAGKIKITDRSGAAAEIDLRAAQTVDDVLEAINTNTEINITATAEGDRIKLTDTVGGSTSNLVVQEVGLGTTAASLGLAGINEPGNEASGDDIFTLHGATKLTTLNDGVGVRILNDLEDAADIEVALADETTAQIDLSGATTLQAIVDKINDDETLSGKVTASIAADGNRLEITDNTTGAGEFSVSSYGGGSTAEDLGLTETAVGGVITGRRLTAGLRDTLVSSLNGGVGFELDEIDITDRAGVTSNVQLAGAETLGDIVDLINAAGANVTASVNNARNGVQIVDNTEAGDITGSLVIASSGSGTTAEDLGIAVDDAVGSVNSGTLRRQTISASTLLSSLNGGTGVILGDIRFTDSNGAKGVVDLNKVGAEAETIGDVIDAVNALTNGVSARINDAGDGILITDTAGGSGDLIIKDVSGKTGAGLGIIGTATETDNEGNQIVNGSTSYSVSLDDLSADVNNISLASLNDGAGVDPGVFRVFASDSTDETPKSFIVNLADAVTLGDLLEEFNSAAEKAGAAVTAQVTESGTGIELVDTAGGAGSLRVEDLNGSLKPAADLGIAREAGAANSAGEQKISSFGLFDADAAEASALELVAERINDFEAGVTASVVFDGFGYRLAVDADESGSANELLIDDSAGLFTFEEISRPKNAVLLFGESASSPGVAVSSPTNKFNQVVDGLDLTLAKASSDAVTVTVTKDNAPISTAVRNFVAAYNSIRTNLGAVTDFDADTNTTGVLFGRNEALRVDTTLSRIASGAFAVGGSFTSLESIGVSLGDDGKLTLDATKLTDALAENAGEVEQLLSDDGNGVLAKFTAAIDQLAKGENSLLTSRSESLQNTIDTNNARLESMSQSLDRQRDRLLLEFYTLEETIAGFQSNLDLLDGIKYISPTGA